MLRRVARRGAQLAAAGTLVSSAAVGGLAAYDQGFRRQLSFWATVLPGVCQYRYASWKYADVAADSRAQEFAKLHKTYAPVALQLILSLRGLFVKFGQVCSVRPEFVPQAYRDAFRALQSDVPGEPVSVVRAVIEAEFGQPLDSIFSSFEETPCGAASIGQAHAAVVARSGESVVVKVQYPDARWQFMADIDCLRTLVGWAQPDSIPAYEEFARQFVEELDYVQERRHLQAVYAAIMPTFGHVVAIPEALPHLCTPKVLTMTMLDGPKLEEEARRQLLAIGVDVSSGNVSDVIKRSATATVSTGEGTNSAGNGVTTDTLSPPVAAPIQPRFASVGRLVVRILGVERSLQLWANLAWSWNVLARQIGAGAEASSNNATVTTAVTRGWMDTLLEVHGHEVFLTDRFNADPHPGNIVVMADGRLGLIDYGQCKELSLDSRRLIAKLVVAIADGRPQAEVAAAFRACGMVTKNDEDEFMAKFASLLFGKLQPEMMERDWHVRLHKLDRIVIFPSELIMMYRMATLLRGLSLALRYNIGVAEHWRGAALKLLETA